MTRDELVTVLNQGGQGVGLGLEEAQVEWIIGFVDEYADSCCQSCDGHSCE